MTEHKKQSRMRDLSESEDSMQRQDSATATSVYSRRVFLKRAALGLAAVTAATLAAGQLMLRRDGRAELPGAGSIFEPRRQDLLRHWRQKAARFRLR